VRYQVLGLSGRRKTNIKRKYKYAILCLEGMTGQEGMQIWRSFTVIRLLRRSKICGDFGQILHS